MIQIILSQLSKRIITGLILLVCVFFFIFYASPFIFFVALAGCGFVILKYELPQLASSRFQFLSLALAYIILPFLLSLHLYSDPRYRILLLIVICITSSNDIGAYFAGTFLGKHTIAPSISPKKTWEGFLGGMFAVMVALILISHVWLHRDLSFSFIMYFSFAIAVIATTGDFFESWLKRRAGIKDSGTILPGHGGLLDRCDSLIFVIIICYALKDSLLRVFLK